MTVKPDPKRRALGRGLDALLPSAPTTPSSMGSHGSPFSSGASAASGARNHEPIERTVFSCAIEKLTPQKGQPRQHFPHLEELAASLKEHGQLEPIVVRRPVPGADRFEIIAGERRWRAAQKAGLREVMVIVKDVSPRTAFELALIENVQREDLNAIELAEALARLVEEHGYTQESLATRLGKDRTTISNSLRLLKLPERIRRKVVEGELTEGHARALLGAPEGEMDGMAEKVLRGKLSVRATEALVRKHKARGSAGTSSTPPAKSPAVRDLESRLTRTLGTRVLIKSDGNGSDGKKSGEVVIPYADLDALDRLIDKLGA